MTASADRRTMDSPVPNAATITATAADTTTTPRVSQVVDGGTRDQAPGDGPGAAGGEGRWLSLPDPPDVSGDFFNAGRAGHRPLTSMSANTPNDDE